MPVLYEFCPNIILIAGGFDASLNDPLGECKVTENCFSRMTWHLMSIAKIAIFLEGGKNV